jgi:hypothetical protein
VANIKDYVPLAASLCVRNHTTYVRVTLFKGGTRHYRQVHRLVAETFIPNPQNLPEIDHQDNNGENNAAKNLQWVTRTRNIQLSFERNPNEKLKICSAGGKVSGAMKQAASEKKHKEMLNSRFLKFFPSGEISKEAAVRYTCECGVQRTAEIVWKELRQHSGKCPACTNTVKRSSQSLE